MTDSHRGLPFPRRAVAIVAMCTGSMLLMIDSSIAGVALPTIAKALDVPDALIVLVVTAYQLILAMAVLPFAALGDRIGHRRLFQAGLLLHCCAGVLSFFANSLVAIIALRSLQALGTAAALSVAAAFLLSDRVSAALLTLIAMIFASMGLLLIAFLPLHPHHFDIVWRMALCGVGFGMFSTPNARLIVASAPVTRMASAGSIFSTTRMLSLAIGTTLVAALLEQGFGEGPTPAMAAMCLTAITGAISIPRMRTVKTPSCAGA